jgi:hypothetical protein
MNILFADFISKIDFGERRVLKIYRLFHITFFKLSKEERIGQMSGYKRRRGYRI